MILMYNLYMLSLVRTGMGLWWLSTGYSELSLCHVFCTVSATCWLNCSLLSSLLLPNFISKVLSVFRVNFHCWSQGRMMSINVWSLSTAFCMPMVATRLVQVPGVEGILLMYVMDRIGERLDSWEMPVSSVFGAEKTEPTRAEYVLLKRNDCTSLASYGDTIMISRTMAIELMSAIRRRLLEILRSLSDFGIITTVAVFPVFVEIGIGLVTSELVAWVSSGQLNSVAKLIAKSSAFPGESKTGPC
ncbi:hypothetical protein QTP88_018185 [Uroleucon formosanum]